MTQPRSGGKFPTLKVDKSHNCFAYAERRRERGIFTKHIQMSLIYPKKKTKMRSKKECRAESGLLVVDLTSQSTRQLFVRLIFA